MAADVELVDPERADDLIVRGQPLAVEPDVGRVVEARKLQTRGLPGLALGHDELRAVPPWAFELLGVDVVEVGPDVKIGVEPVGDHRRHRCRRHGGGVPAGCVESGRRHRCAVRRDLGGRAQEPPLAQLPGGVHRALGPRATEADELHNRRQADAETHGGAVSNSHRVLLPSVPSHHTAGHRTGTRYRLVPSIRDR